MNVRDTKSFSIVGNISIAVSVNIFIINLRYDMECVFGHDVPSISCLDVISWGKPCGYIGQLEKHLVLILSMVINGPQCEAYFLCVSCHVKSMCGGGLLFLLFTFMEWCSGNQTFVLSTIDFFCILCLYISPFL